MKNALGFYQSGQQRKGLNPKLPSTLSETELHIMYKEITVIKSQLSCLIFSFHVTISEMNMH